MQWFANLINHNKTKFYSIHLNVESLIKLRCMFLDYRMKAWVDEPTHTWGKRADSTQKDPRLRFKPGTLSLWENSADHHVTEQPLMFEAHLKTAGTGPSLPLCSITSSFPDVGPLVEEWCPIQHSWVQEQSFTTLFSIELTYPISFCCDNCVCFWCRH